MVYSTGCSGTRRVVEVLISVWRSCLGLYRCASSSAVALCAFAFKFECWSSFSVLL